jgi:ABC-2 type transport system permease protein
MSSTPVALVRPRGELAQSWQRIRAVARRHAYVLKRSPHRSFDVAVWPLVDVLLFGSLGVFVRHGSSGRTEFLYLLSGIILWHVIYQSQIALATGFLEEIWTRTILDLMVTPIAEIEYVLGVVLFSVVKLTIGVSVVGVAAVGFYAFNITDLGWGLIPVVAILLVVGWSIALIVIGIVLRFGSGAEAFAWGIMFVIMPLSGVFYPISSLPAVLRPLAIALPTTHAFAVARGLLNNGAFEWSQMWIATGGAIVLLAASTAFVISMLAMFRRRGYVTRYS